MRLSRVLFSILSSAIALTLSGCAGMNSNFDCKEVGGLGAGCVSLDQTNDMANQGVFNKNASGMNASNQKNQTVPVTFNATTSVQNLANQPLRYGETVQNIWIAPYVDTEGNYNWPSVVSIIVEPGHWVGSPASAIQVSGEE